MGDFFQIIAAGPFFFVSSWVLMIFAGIVAADVGIRPVRLYHVDGRHHRAVADAGASGGAIARTSRKKS